LTSCCTLSMPGQKDPNQEATYQWFNITGGLTAPTGGLFQHRTAHMAKALPVGGNQGMLDGHVEWRKFQYFLPRTVDSVNGVAIPVFWW